MAYQLLEDDAPTKGYTLIEDGKKGTGSTVLDSGNAVGTGFWNGMTRLAGMPADAAYNVRDLLKAAGGVAYHEATGNQIPSWMEVGDRSKDIASGDQLLQLANRTSAGKTMLEPANPSYQGGYLQTAGMGLTGIVNPRSAAQAVNQGVNSVLGAVGGKAVFDATGSTPLAIAAGMTPTLAQSVGTSGLKYAVRGSEDGRKTMEQRIQDLKNAGIDKPTLGLASGNSFIGGLENILQSTPGAVNIMRNARQTALDGLEGTVSNAADLASTNRGSIASGQSIQSGAKTFATDAKAQTNSLYDNMGRFIPAQTPVDVRGTKTALSNLNATIEGAPELSKQFMNARIKSIEAAMQSDTQGTAPGVMLDVRGGGGIMNAPVVREIGIPGGSTTNSLPFEAVKKTRTLVGNEIDDTNLASAVPRSKWNPLYAALSGDMQTAANTSGPQATNAFNRATDYTRSSIGRMERIDPIVNRTTPEDSFNALNRTLKDNTTTFQAVKKSLPEGARGDFAGTVIENLGTAGAGKQDATGGKFSTETFLTNWNKMSQTGKDELLSGFPNSQQVKSDIEAVAKATSMMRDNSEIWSNPSGTGANLASRGYLGLLGAGVGSLLSPSMAANPGLLGAAALLPASANAAARFTTSPTFVKNMASKSYIDPQMLNAQINTLIGSGLLN